MYLEILTPDNWSDYTLLDSGDGQKLERYGPYVFIRPETQALWTPSLSRKEWQTAHATFVPTRDESGGNWQFHRNVVAGWLMRYNKLKFQVRTTAGRHLGVFPEQASQWDWISNLIQQSKRDIHVLNLFGYTGLASLAAAEAGARVTHVDASKKSIQWARHNQEVSGLEKRPIRWITDDAVKYVQREQRRGVRYDGIILDPPKFGRGPKGEVWEFFKLYPRLLNLCKRILSSEPIFLVVTAYAIRASALSLYYSISEVCKDLNGLVTAGELALTETSAGRQIPMAIFARWQSPGN